MIDRVGFNLKGKTEDETVSFAFSFVKRMASRTRYAGTEGEKETCEDLFNEFEGLGCDVEKDETEYIKKGKLSDRDYPIGLLGLRDFHRCFLVCTPTNSSDSYWHLLFVYTKSSPEPRA